MFRSNKKIVISPSNTLIRLLLNLQYSKDEI